MSQQITKEPIHLDFKHLISATPHRLIMELTDCHETIANLSVQIAFLRGEEERGGDSGQQAKTLRREYEGAREAYVEKKWLVKTLLDRTKDG